MTANTTPEKLSSLLEQIAQAEELTSIEGLIQLINAHLDGATAAHDAILSNPHYPEIVKAQEAKGRLPASFTPLLEATRAQATIARDYLHPEAATKSSAKKSI